MKYQEHEISDKYLNKWQMLLNMIARITDVPAALIMRVTCDEIELLLSNDSDRNPYKQGDKAPLGTGFYCETVMSEESQLLIPNALSDEAWKDNPDAEVGMIAYFGVPLIWPDGQIFGTLCIQDNKTREFSELFQTLIWEIKLIIEADFIEYTNTNEDLAILSAAIKQSPVTVLITTPEGIIEYANPKFFTLTGYTQKEVLGRKPSILKSGRTPDDTYKQLWKTVLSGNKWHGEFENKKKNGELYWEDATISAIFDDSGNIIKLMALKEDVTERKLINDERAMLMSAIEQTKDTVELLDKDGLIQYANLSFEKTTGYTLDEARGKNPLSLFNNDQNSNEAVSREAWETVTGGKPWQGRFTNKKKDGSLITEDVSISPVLDKNGEIINYTSVKRNVTESLLIEREREKQKDQLHQEHKMESLGQLAGGIAHDFNNVLSGIMSAAQLLKSPKRELDEKSLKYIDMILKSSKRAADLTAKLLTFGRKGEIKFTLIDLHKLIEEVINILKLTIDKRISISFDKRAENHFINANKTEIQNVLLNLAINASHSMTEAGRINIQTKVLDFNQAYCEASSFEIEPGEYIEVKVQDTGCGIPPENIKKIFDPFFTTKGLSKGTGLGLSSVYGTVRDHHGVLDVKSIVGVGTSFYIWLPCLEETIQSKPEIDEVVPGMGTILLVDDEEFNRLTGRDMLESLGYKILLAENGLEAVNIYREQYSEIDLVVMDMIMPLMNGSEAYERIKEINADCKVIIASGYTNKEDISKLRESGLKGFIQKPYRPSDLSRMIIKTMNQK